MKKIIFIAALLATQACTVEVRDYSKQKPIPRTIATMSAEEIEDEYLIIEISETCRSKVDSERDFRKCGFKVLRENGRCKVKGVCPE